MYSENVTVVNATGIHARPASQFSKMAAGFQSNVTVKKSDAEGDGVNAPSLPTARTRRRLWPLSSSSSRVVAASSSRALLYESRNEASRQLVRGLILFGNASVYALSRSAIDAQNLSTLQSIVP